MTPRVAPASDQRLPGNHLTGETLPLFESMPSEGIRPAPAWRARIKVHPAASLFEVMYGEELDALAEDIAKNGLRQAVALWTPEQPGSQPPKEVYLLDGRNRLEAIERGFASDPEARAMAITRALSCDADGGGTARLLYGDTDPWGVVVSLNLQRRHLTREQTHKVIVALLKQRPKWSDRKIAKLANRTDKTIGAVRRRLERTAEIPQFEKRTGADGKKRPARHSTPKTASTPRASATQLRDVTISGFSKILHQHLTDTLDDLTRLLGNEQVRIAELPRQKRIELARNYLRVLDLGVDDLLPHEGA